MTRLTQTPPIHQPAGRLRPAMDGSRAAEVGGEGALSADRIERELRGRLVVIGTPCAEACSRWCGSCLHNVDQQGERGSNGIYKAMTRSDPPSARLQAGG
jgi:hypothetical protein